MIMMRTKYRKKMNSDDDNTNDNAGYIVIVLRQILEYEIHNQQGQVASSLGFREVLLGLRVPGFVAKGSWLGQQGKGTKGFVQEVWGAELGEGLT